MSSKVADLKAQVSTAGGEFDTVVSFHEVWRFAAYDKDLHDRMGQSYATKAFHLIRIALRREVFLGLMRLWGSRSDEIRVDHIVKELKKPSVFDELIRERMKTWPFDEGDLRSGIQSHVDAAAEIVAKYSKGGCGEGTIQYLRGVRNDHLAHRSKLEAKNEAASYDDEKIEELYGDMARLISELFSAVLSTAYDPKETADVFKIHASFFWEAARGERTEGHPRYRAPPSVDGATITAD